MPWPDEILRDFAQTLDDTRQAMMADIARDLKAQGASSDSIADSLRGVDELFTESVRRGLTVFAATLAAELRDMPDGTIH